MISTDGAPQDLAVAISSNVVRAKRFLVVTVAALLLSSVAIGATVKFLFDHSREWWQASSVAEEWLVAVLSLGGLVFGLLGLAICPQLLVLSRVVMPVYRRLRGDGKRS